MIKIFLLYSCLFFSTIVFADDCGKFSLSVRDINLQWSENFTSQSQPITILRTKSKKTCSYYVTFSAGTAGTSGSYQNRYMTSGGTQLKYQIYKTSNLQQSNILKELPAASSNDEVLTGTFADSQAIDNNNYYLEIPLQAATQPTLVKSGVYQDTYAVKVYQGTIGDSGDSPDDTSSIHITTTVPKIIRISMVPMGSPFNANYVTENLDFGELQTGATKSFDLKIVTNAGYVLQFSSQNNGVLANLTPGVDSTVAYSLAVNSVPKNLSGSAANPVTVAQASGQTSQEGQTNQISVTIGDVTNKVAGNYSDVILVTASTTE